jgi:uncharacterized protein (DUF2126 family)
VLRDLQRSRVRPPAGMVRGPGRIPFSVLWRGRLRGRTHLELRQALEPWHVLGETGAIGGTVRYTDSSTERLQVKLETGPIRTATLLPATGAGCPAPAKDRRQKMCLGASVQGVASRHGAAPGAAGRRAADLRYLRYLDRPRRWADASITWPIPADETTRPSRSTPTRPKPAACTLRAHGHTPGSYMPRRKAPHPEFPMTLDLRRRRVSDRDEHCKANASGPRCLRAT